jgi:hypothetical protein
MGETTVFVVTAAPYLLSSEDIAIRGVYSTRDKAQDAAVAIRRSQGGHTWIDPLVVDAEPKPEG